MLSRSSGMTQFHLERFLRQIKNRIKLYCALISQVDQIGSVQSPITLQKRIIGEINV